MLHFIFKIFVFFILIILQFVVPKYFPLYNFYPNFILIYIVYIGLNKGSIKGELTGFFYGLIWDILSTDILGIRTLTFTISGYLSPLISPMAIPEVSSGRPLEPVAPRL